MSCKEGTEGVDSGRIMPIMKLAAQSVGCNGQSGTVPTMAKSIPALIEPVLLRWARKTAGMDAVPWVGSVRANQAPETVASKLRSLLNVIIKEQRSWRDAADARRNWIHRCEAVAVPASGVAPGRHIRRDRSHRSPKAS